MKGSTHTWFRKQRTSTTCRSADLAAAGAAHFNREPTDLALYIELAMMFSNEHSTPLFSLTWKPASLVAAKSILERRWIDAKIHSRYVLVGTPYDERNDGDPNFRKGVLMENGLENNILLVRRQKGATQPRRILFDVQRAAINTLISMLSIMSMNLGYFLSTLGGIFLGSLAVGVARVRVPEWHAAAIRNGEVSRGIVQRPTLRLSKSPRWSFVARDRDDDDSEDNIIAVEAIPVQNGRPEQMCRTIGSTGPIVGISQLMRIILKRLS
ncbi:hypothetical protein Purlil1_13227 [Purpureocillium lilacinum]|uniref:Uncharacterized protein n=1 Tax=Purpureocillium lilacinum TaxID=33203 RepID=A0ABR0BER2_PURLI|nr:hypothetical protein Purlil1_13227 [Purpureocillium lilacinum]